MKKTVAENMKHMTGVRPMVDVVGDLPYKKEFMTNSFFSIGHFDVDGHLINYLYHLITFEFPGKEKLIASCFSVTDETDQKYYGDTKIYPVSQTVMETDHFELKAPGGEMWGDLNKMYLHAVIPEAELQVELVPVGYPLYNALTGKFKMVGLTIHQYSIPTVETKGTLRIEDKVYELDGISWFDRQWQNKIPNIPGIDSFAKIIHKIKKNGSAFPAWGWMDMNLENGDVISLWVSFEKGEEVWGTLMHPDGIHEVLEINSMLKGATDWWKSPKSGFEYPTKWIVSIPKLSAELTVVSAPKEQDLPCEYSDDFSHYEAASQITGTYQGKPMNGYCYVELIGPWYKDKLN